MRLVDSVLAAARFDQLLQLQGDPVTTPVTAKGRKTKAYYTYKEALGSYMSFNLCFNSFD